MNISYTCFLLSPFSPLTSPLRVLYIEVYLYQITIFGSRSIQYLWTQTFQGWLAGFPRSRTNTTIKNHMTHIPGMVARLSVFLNNTPIKNHKAHIPGMVGSFPRSRTNATIENHIKHIPGMVGRFSAFYKPTQP
jgi:hypothetical protein